MFFFLKINLKSERICCKEEQQQEGEEAGSFAHCEGLQACDGSAQDEGVDVMST